VLSALGASQATCRLITGIHGAPEHIRFLVDDIKDFGSILETLSMILNDSETAVGILHPRTSTDLEPILEACQMTFQEIDNIVTEFEGRQGEFDTRIWRRLKWVFKEEEISRLSKDLAERKTTLNLAISIASL
jgi:hypothetical protein